MMNNKGITLIEMLVTITILGIVSAISIPSATTIFENAEKDEILSYAVTLERAAKNYCRQDNYVSCPAGTELTYAELSPFINNIDTSYEMLVTVGGGLRNFFVYYAKEGEFSFPYTENGVLVFSNIDGVSYMGAVATTADREMINIPTTDSMFDAPDWEPGVFGVGDFFVYDNKLWEVRYDGFSNQPPEGSILQPFGPFQEITEFYRPYNTYLTGDTVIYNNATFTALHDGMSGIEPGTAFGWQEQTPNYRPFNTYTEGDIVIHNGAQFQAMHSGMSGIEPGTAWGWQELTDEWRFYNTYQAGDEVTHTVDGEVKEFVALYYSQGSEPGFSSAWEEIVDLGEFGVWNEFQAYQAGTFIVHNDALFEARNYASPGQEPGLLSSPWNEITEEWRFFNVYTGGDLVIYNGILYEAQWWNQNVIPGTSSVWQVAE
jgi:prepilin-type N-terminal cleavage/methylation domain-containing protein